MILARRRHPLVAAPYPATQTDVFRWVSADSGVTQGGGKVTGITDRKSTSTTWTNATTSQQPTYDATAYGGKGGIRHAGGQFLKDATCVLTQPYTIYLVCKADNPAANTNQYILDDGGDATWVQYYNSYGGLSAFNARTDFPAGSTAAFGAGCIVCIVYNGSTSTVRYNAASASGNLVGAYTNGVCIGCYYGAVAGLVGTWAEFIACKAVHSVAQQDAMFSYLSRWGTP